MRRISAALLFFLLFAVGWDLPALAQEGSSARRAEPVVTTQSQPGSPLSIASKTQWLKPDEQVFDLYIEVTNIGDKPIRAYATYHADTREGQGSRRCFLHNVSSLGKVLQPGQKDGRSVWRRATDPGSQPNIELAVDFVEFTDGTVWGMDTCESVQRLDGLRAGAHASKAHLKRILQGEGAERVVVDLKERSRRIDPPAGRSTVWMEGFRAGVSSFRERVVRAYEEGGIPDINTALNRAFDASEGP